MTSALSGLPQRLYTARTSDVTAASQKFQDASFLAGNGVLYFLSGLFVFRGTPYRWMAPTLLFLPACRSSSESSSVSFSFHLLLPQFFFFHRLTEMVSNDTLLLSVSEEFIVTRTCLRQ